MEVPRSVTWCGQRPMAAASLSSQPMGSERSDRPQFDVTDLRAGSAGDSPCDVVRCGRRSGRSRSMVKQPSGSSSERPVVLWKTLPAATFVSPLGLAGQTSKPPVLDCRPAAGNPDLSCATRAPIRAQPHSFDRLGAGRTDSEEEGQHGRILHTNSQHSRRMDGPCGHCE